MNWIKNNLGMVFCALVFAALMGAAGWQIQKAFVKRSGIEQDLQAKQDKIQSLRTAKIFPSKENIDALRRDRLELAQLYSNVQEQVRHTIVPPPTVKRDVDFSLFLVETQTGLRTLAGESNTNLANQAFGFDRYRDAYPCRSANIRGSDCDALLNSLAKQVLVVDKITRMLFESGTHDLLEVRRSQLPAETLSPNILPWTPPSDPKALFVAMPFQFKFACDKTEVLQTFLNKLTHAKLFLVVKDLGIETESKVKRDPNQPTARFEPIPESTAPVEMQHRLIVTVRIDWVEFTSPSIATNRAAKK